MMSKTVRTNNSNVVNGINVDSLMACAPQVEQDATVGKTNWRVTTTSQEQTRSRAEVLGFGDSRPPNSAFGSVRQSVWTSFSLGGMGRSTSAKQRSVLPNSTSLDHPTVASANETADGRGAPFNGFGNCLLTPRVQ